MLRVRVSLQRGLQASESEVGYNETGCARYSQAPRVLVKPTLVKPFRAGRALSSPVATTKGPVKVSDWDWV